MVYSQVVTFYHDSYKSVKNLLYWKRFGKRNEIEAMEGYPGTPRVSKPRGDSNLTQI